MTGPNPYRSGGNIKNIPQPHRRFYDDRRRKRPVEVRIICYRDYGGIGTHYYTTIEETANPIWDSQEITWASAWDDEKGKGKKFAEKFNSYLQAERYVRKILDKHFSKRTHKFMDWKSSRVFHYREDN